MTQYKRIIGQLFFEYAAFIIYDYIEEVLKMILMKKAKKEADIVYEKIYARLREKEKSFYRDFFECAADELYADLYDYFFDLRFYNNVFKKCIFKPNGIIFERFFKIMAGFYTINFLSIKIDRIDPLKLEEMLFWAYGMDEVEIKLYEIMKEVAENYKHEFMNMFVYSMKRYVLFMEDKNYFYLAFSANFCYNSYKMFCEFFTKYESIEYRLNKYVS